jgi:nucleotide-binding universal stress UspA family protein
VSSSSPTGDQGPPVASSRPAVCVPFAFTTRCRHALSEALAQVDHPGELTVLHAVRETSDDDEVAGVRARLIDELHRLGCPTARLEIVRGAAGPAIAGWVREQHPDLVVVPRTRKGWLRRAVFGSVVEPVVRDGRTRVLVLPEST